MNDLNDACQAALAASWDAFDQPLATILPDAHGEPIAECRVEVSELADSVAQSRYGQDAARMVDVTVRRTDLGGQVVGRGCVVVIAGGAQEGEWYVLGVERADDAAVVLRARMAGRINSAGPGAREVRR